MGTVMIINAVIFFAAPLVLWLLVPNADAVVKDAKVTRKVNNVWKDLQLDLDALGLEVGLQQLEALQRKSDVLEKTLNDRFSDTEITGARYRMIIEEVRLGILSNLKRQVDIARAAKLVNEDETRTRLESLDPNSPSEQAIAKTLQERLSLTQGTDAKLASLDASNEQALTALDQAAITLTELDTGTKPNAAKLESCVADLEKLVSRAHRLEDIAIDTSGTASGKRAKKSTAPPTITPGSS